MFFALFITLPPFCNELFHTTSREVVDVPPPLDYITIFVVGAFMQYSVMLTEDGN
jgi:hypothetical protein